MSCDWFYLTRFDVSLILTFLLYLTHQEMPLESRAAHALTFFVNLWVLYLITDLIVWIFIY